MSDNESMEFSLDDSIHIKPIDTKPVTKVNNKLFESTNLNPSLIVNSCMNVLSVNKLSDKFIINERFEQYLTEDTTNPDAIIVSFLGPKKIGKSFLVDSLLTAQCGRVCRIMSKSNEKIVNSPTITTKSRSSQSRIIYLDLNGDTSSELFLWSYFLSSVIVYNLNSNTNEERSLLQHLIFIKSHLDYDDDEDLSLPQLIILRRDSESGRIDRDLLLQIENLGLFQPNISVINMPYPGTQNVASKELLDVPLKQINPSYINQVEKLLKEFKSAKSKTIKGNYLSTKILSLALEAVAKSINKEHRININKVWDELIENLSIGFYNYYLKKYQDELLSQFGEEKPCDKYTLYKRFRNIKRRVDKKVQGFKNLESDLIFSKYKSRLSDAIKTKENLIKQVNKEKSREVNDQYCKRLLNELDNQNCAQLIRQYCKSGLDDQKCEVLVENFEKIVDERTKHTKGKKGNTAELQRQIESLQQEIEAINRKIKEKSKPSAIPSFDWEGKKSIILQKRAKYEKLNQQCEQLKQNIKTLTHSQKPNAQLIKIQDECEKLRAKIQKNERETTELRLEREQQIKQTTKQLEQRLKKQEDILKDLEERLRLARQRLKSLQQPVKPKDNKCCCSIM